MTTYRERLTAPVSWWIAALGFAVVWGWVFLVVTTWPISIVVTILLTAAGFFAVWRYGSVLVTVDADGLRVGPAFVEAAHVGTATALDRAGYRSTLGTGADARAYLVTRPYLDHGVTIAIDDPSDPVPYWLVSSRHPEELAVALGSTAPTTPLAPATPSASSSTVHEPIGEAPRGEEAQ